MPPSVLGRDLSARVADAQIAVEVERGRARITLNRPEKRNALSLQLLEELHEALWDADADREVHSVIVRGAGPCFSAGYDLAEAPRRRRRERGGASYRGARSFDDDAGSSSARSGCAWRCSTCTSR